MKNNPKNQQEEKRCQQHGKRIGEDACFTYRNIPCHCPCIGHLEGCEMRMPIIEQAGNTTTEEVHEIIDNILKNLE